MSPRKIEAKKNITVSLCNGSTNMLCTYFWFIFLVVGSLSHSNKLLQKMLHIPVAYAIFRLLLADADRNKFLVCICV